jgi:hypothetical protein
MAIRVSSRKMSTVWSLNGLVSEKSWPHPRSADVVEGVVTTAVEEPPGETNSSGRCAAWGEGNSPGSVPPETGGVQTAPDCIKAFKWIRPR